MSQVENKAGVKPQDLSMENWVESRIARFEGRKYDWNALKFQADFDPKYRRAQMRYIGTGATGVASDANTIPAGNFTFSTMVLPSKCEGPLHLHDDVEEVFFMLKGSITLMIQDGEEYYETRLKERDLISVPANTRHWFDMGSAPHFTAIRVFDNPEGWVAHFTGDKIADDYPRLD